MERIFENPILLFIVIAFISSLFAKSKGSTENKRRTLPDLKKELEETYREITRQEQPGHETAPPVRNHKPLHPKEKIKQAVKPAARGETPPAMMERAKNPGSVRGSIRQEQTHANEEMPAIEPVTEKNLADAIVWAEILGPPRAKKPYYKR
ncbi:hypothetical protein [Bacillus sp. B-jedd]|uniref:hypothetical protein n=1 Tax=Bacillus sp. B-jedd TaxID=1476857 RepID=UPI0005155CD3|nr:hypothetical protein [Bacillus sp. B-jedd]CEG27909.1 hypothetical protein BN1002_02783 [Bacillus sp. B-jedd]